MATRCSSSSTFVIPFVYPLSYFFPFLSYKRMKLTLRGKDGQQDYCRPKQKKLDAFTKKIREILKRNRGVSIQRIVAELNAYLRGWINYYARSC